MCLFYKESNYILPIFTFSASILKASFSDHFQSDAGNKHINKYTKYKKYNFIQTLVFVSV